MSKDNDVMTFLRYQRTRGILTIETTCAMAFFEIDWEKISDCSVANIRRIDGRNCVIGNRELLYLRKFIDMHD